MTITASGNDVGMRQGRRLEIDRHPAPPAGLEIHSSGMRHEAQRGDSVYAIARDYSRAFHMNISPRDIQNWNKAALADGLQAGELLALPPLETRTDIHFGGNHPNLTERRGQLRHVVSKGQSLSSIAGHYRRTERLDVTAKTLHAANRDIIGANPNLIRAGQPLRIPGITNNSPAAMSRTLSQLDLKPLLTRTSRVRHEDGSVETIEIESLTAMGSHAQRVGRSADDAMHAARKVLASDSRRSDKVAVAQTRDGAYWIIPLQSQEISDNLDDSDRTLSLAYRANDREVVGIATREHDGGIIARRFDR